MGIIKTKDNGFVEGSEVYERKKKIAFIIPTVGIVNRGAETYTIEMTKYLSQYYDIDVYCCGMEESIKEHIIKIDFEKPEWLVKYEAFLNKPSLFRCILRRTRYLMWLEPGIIYNYLFAQKIYKECLISKKYDLLFPKNGMGSFPFVRKIRRKYGTPFMDSGGAGIGACDWWMLVMKPDAYVAISTAQKKWAEKYCKNVYMIPNGTFVPYFKNYRMEKEPFVINSGNKLIIACGNLDTYFKRHQLTIEAVAGISNVDLLILGNGDEEDKLMKLASEKMPERCVIKSVSHSDMAYYYHSADLFTLASINEPFGIVYIEAMASGLPVVTTDDLVRREIVGNAGILCDVENIEEYARALEKALEMEWGTKPQEKAARYDYSIVGEEYHQLIERITSI